jgi:lipoate-protein ligase A
MVEGHLTGRLLELTLGDPFSNVALEEALLWEARVPTLRIWENQKSVVIGRAQLAGFETDLEYCKTRSVPVVRRITGGGAVYNGPGNLNWSFVLRRGQSNEEFREAFDAGRVFATFAAQVVGALRGCGVGCRFEPPNSILGADGKISGMAALITKEGVLCHGTLLVHAELDEVQRLTEPRRASISGRYPRSRFVRVSNCGVARQEFVARLSSSAMGFKEGPGTRAEEELCSRLTAKYRSPEWNLGDPFGLNHP